MVGNSRRFEALGVDSANEIDFDNPTAVLESDGEGASYLTVDLTSQFAPMVASNPALGDLGRIELGLWTTPDTVVFDTTDYSAIDEINPGQLGMLSPGVFSVDLARVDDIAGDDLAKLLVGSSVPDIDFSN